MINRTLYSLALYVLAPLALPLYEARNRFSGRGAGGVWPRLMLGAAPAAAGGKNTVWLHAVSVGETLAVEPVLAALRQNHDAYWLVSSVTRTGHALARKRLPADQYTFFPLDFPGACRRALRAFTPTVILYAETEVWPNFIHYAAASGVRQALINGRISERSWRGYRRWRRLFAPALRQLDLLLMQSDGDAERVIDLGADPARVRVCGNTKYDRTAALAAAPPHPVTEDMPPYWVAASTHPGEEEQVVAAHAELKEKMKLLLAPRHPHRAGDVERLVAGQGLTVQRLSVTDAWQADVLLVDTIGDLDRLYANAQFVFMGGSWVPHGGQNMLEPAACGVPVFYGRHTFNFRDAVALLEGHGGTMVAAPPELLEQVHELQAVPGERARRGAAARQTVLGRAGASVCIAAAVGEWLP